MTAIEQYHEPVLATVDRQAVAIHRLAEWAASAEAAMNVATQLVKTSFVPEAFRGKPFEATAAILAGLECGLSPMAALRSFDVIQGQAAPRALTLRAIVQSHGHEMVVEESTATRCKMRGRRNGTNEWQTIVWTIDRARALSLAGKPNWKNQPQAMLVARATSELARLIAADAILGIGYSVEEIADGGGSGVEVAAETAAVSPEPGKRKMSRNMTPAPVADDTVTDAEIVEEAPTSGPTPKQIKKMMACFNEIGIKDRKDRLAFIAAAVRPVDSSNDLTIDEAGIVIDRLEQVISGALTIGYCLDGTITLDQTVTEPDLELDPMYGNS